MAVLWRRVKCLRTVPIGTDRNNRHNLDDGDDSSPFDSLRFMTMLWRGWISNRALRHIGIVTVQFVGFYLNVITCGCLYGNNIKWFVKVKWSLLRCWN